MQPVALLFRSRRLRKLGFASIFSFIALGFYIMSAGAALFASAVGGSTSDATSGSQLASCVGPAVIAPQTTAADLSPEQKSTAAAIIGVGRSLGVPDYGLVIAIATSMQEAGLRQINYGDRDSLGPFQQRTSWGPAPDRINAATSALRFFKGGDAGQRGLLDIPNWQQMPLTEAAQAVQVSAFPDAYAKWSSLAVNVVTGTPPNTGTTTTISGDLAPPSACQ